MSVSDNPVTIEAVTEDELLLEEADIIEDLTEEIEGEEAIATAPSNLKRDGAENDPLRTATLAELYVSQGVLESALEIYSDLIEKEPSNTGYARRCSEIRQMMTADGGSQAFAEEDTTGCSTVQSLPPSPVVATLTGDDVVSLLEGWLENIGRRKR